MHKFVKTSEWSRLKRVADHGGIRCDHVGWELYRVPRTLADLDWALCQSSEATPNYPTDDDLIAAFRWLTAEPARETAFQVAVALDGPLGAGARAIAVAAKRGGIVCTGW